MDNRDFGELLHFFRGYVRKFWHSHPQEMRHDARNPAPLIRAIAEQTPFDELRQLLTKNEGAAAEIFLFCYEFTKVEIEAENGKDCAQIFMEAMKLGIKQNRGAEAVARREYLREMMTCQAAQLVAPIFSAYVRDNWPSCENELLAMTGTN